MKNNGYRRNFTVNGGSLLRELINQERCVTDCCQRALKECDDKYFLYLHSEKYHSRLISQITTLI